MARLENVAVPRNALRVAVPLRVPVTDETIVIELPARTTGFPPASCTCTWIDGENVCPTTLPLLGPTMKTNRLALPGRMSNPGLVAPVSPPAAAVSVYPLPDLSIERPGKLATPFTAVTVTVPERVP